MDQWHSEHPLLVDCGLRVHWPKVVKCHAEPKRTAAYWRTRRPGSSVTLTSRTDVLLTSGGLVRQLPSCSPAHQLTSSPAHQLTRLARLARLARRPGSLSHA